MKVRAVYRNDGGVSIIHPASKSQKPGESEADWLNRVFQKAMKGHQLENCPYKDIDNLSLPTRRFRNSWVQDTLGVKVNLIKARSQIMLEARSVRDKELLVTDGLTARANEIGTAPEQQQIKGYRQQLRDLPQVLNSKINSIVTSEILESEYPAMLSIEEYITKSTQ